MNSKRQEINKGLGIVLIPAALLYAGFIWRTSFRIAGITYFTLVDDAMVSMRYAQHLAGGFGLVWNIGQKPVEGFTNPGWMLLMAFLHLFPIPASRISLGVMVASALILLGNIAIVYRVGAELRPGSKVAPYLAAGMTAFYFPLIFWSLRGMEVGLLALLIDACILAAIRMSSSARPRDTALLGLLLACAVLVRLDALIQVSLILAYLIAIKRPRRQTLVVPVLTVLLMTIMILGFQRLYFGDFLPNTYYQKMAGTLAWERIRNGLLVFYQHARWDTVLPGLISVVCLALYKDLRRPEMFLLGGLFAAQCAYSVWVGGDYAEAELDSANRFITQGMPALIVLFSAAVDRLVIDPRLRLNGKATARNAAAIFLAMFTLVVMSGRPWLAWARDNSPLLQADIRRTQLGLFIAKHTSPQAVIAVHAAGQIPYYSGRNTIDLLGLNDPVVAKGPVTGPFYPGHDKWNYEYSISRLRPDLIADNWIKLGAFMKDNSEYVHLDNGIYIRRDSILIDVAGISKEYR